MPTAYCLLLTACVKENAVPAYLNLSPFTLNVKLGEGTASHKITDAWVYVNNQSIGNFELPVTIPVAEIGKFEVQIAPGIRNNGVKDNAIIYPMLAFYKDNLEFKPLDTQHILLKTNYLSGLKFWTVEDFDGPNHALKINREVGGTPPSVNIVPNGFEGNAASITLTKASPLMDKALSSKAQLPSTAVATYLELHYKIEAALEVAIWGTSSGNPTGTTITKVILRPNKDWNKTYFNFTAEAKEMKMTDYQISFRSLLPDSLQQATIFLDNIKLIQK